MNTETINRPALAFSAVTVALFFACFLCVAGTQAANNTQIACTPVAQVAVSTQYVGVNIRPFPNTTNVPTGGLKPTQGFVSAEGSTQSNGEWWKLCNSGWVYGQFLTVRTSTPLPTVRAGTLAPTPTRLPSSTPVTPTIPGLQTVTPHPTVNPYMVYDYGTDGKLESVTLFCYEPCQWVILAENLP